MAAKQSWLDEKQSPQIDTYVQKLGTFVDAMADGRIDDKELTDQEKRLVALEAGIMLRAGKNFSFARKPILTAG